MFTRYFPVTAAAGWPLGVIGAPVWAVGIAITQLVV